MKRLVAAIAAIGLVATGAVASVSGVASAEPENLAQLKVSPPPAAFDGFGARKAIVSWDAVAPPGTASYLVVADTNDNFIDPADPEYGPNKARLRVGEVPVDGTRQVLADLLIAGKNYHFAVYALNDTGGVIAPDGAEPKTPIGYVLAEGYNLSITASRTTVLNGNRVVLSGKLSKPDGSPLVGRTITIFRDPYPNADKEQDVATTSVTTGAGGRWTFPAKPAINGRYWARFIPPTGIGGWTKFVGIDVRAGITLHVQPDTSIRHGRRLTFSGRVDAVPAKVAGLPICWQHRAAGSWGGGSCGKIRDNGTYVLRLRPGANADGRYRVHSGLGPAYADSQSRAVAITIR